MGTDDDPAFLREDDDGRENDGLEKGVVGPGCTFPTRGDLLFE